MRRKANRFRFFFYSRKKIERHFSRITWHYFRLLGIIWIFSPNFKIFVALDSSFLNCRFSRTILQILCRLLSRLSSAGNPNDILQITANFKGHSFISKHAHHQSFSHYIVVSRTLCDSRFTDNINLIHGVVF